MTVGTFFLLLVLGATALVLIGLGRSFKLRSERGNFEQDYARSYFSRPGAIALSPEQARIKLRDRNQTKIYPFADVRAWEKHWHNTKREGTLTVSVRDLDQPVWTIKFGNEAEMNRWYELLDQAINDN
ncbi:hypothetical protein Q0S19_06040 [Stenotrophomonas indicatrix]|jgi:hypothetical protein|uniref:hypothetical protein n=1 Tax=Stenotrophomonas TaxID=40323 RepID=UPI0024DE910D|nr:MULTISPECIES: hypothetical protein [Stenotrophomonas]MDN8644030.1 hypothetical protein [Stenotrophomonas indicatrix]MDN8654324.1 hypothetical protein [Stenotrophomonas indicatrix]WIA59973.1 hypothetical protein POS15_11300 [Stenotrophomonas sp. BIO128-Bstrain]